MSGSALPYGRHCVDEDDIAAVAEVLRGDWLTTGPAVTGFERDFAARAAAAHAVACSSGTAALHLAALALGLGPGDAVVVPAITFLATANGPRFTGAEVLFCDVDPETGLIDPAALAALLETHGTIRAVLPVHLAGQCADIAAIAALAAPRGIAIIEDACHALGAHDGTAPVGGCAHSAMTVFSLHPVKTITAGEGGVVTTNDPGLAERLRRLRSHGMIRADFATPGLALAADGTANPWYYEMAEPGFNYRLPDINAALARSQLAKLDRFLERRRALVAAYGQALAGLAPVVRPIARSPVGQPAWHLQVVLIDFVRAGIDRATLMRRLQAQGIGSQVHYIPVHRQPYYQAQGDQPALPGAMAYYARCLSLPLFPAMTETDVTRVAAAVTAALCLPSPGAGSAAMAAL